MIFLDFPLTRLVKATYNLATKVFAKESYMKATKVMIFVCLFIFSFLVSVNAQILTEPNTPKEKIIRRVVEEKAPLRILEVKLYGEAVRLDEKFKMKGDWLQGLEVTIENTSDKNVTFALLQLITKISERELVALPFIFGQKENTSLALAPKAVVTLKPFASDYESFHLSLKSKSVNLDNLDKFALTIDSVQFGNDLMWMRGQFLKPSKTMKGAWIRKDMTEEDLKDAIREKVIKESLENFPEAGNN